MEPLMPIKIAVLKETKPGEKRVSMVPSVVQRLERLGASAVFERGAGTAATFDDGAYSHASFAETPEALVADADIVLAVQPPPAVVAGTMKAGAVLISFVYGQANRELVATLRDKKITAFAMELVPRISRAQSMDALSSQAALAGYYAPLLGAVHMPRILPMMTTAVGSLRAAKVLVMGLGVAGLSALATAHRLGAICEGYDVRPETAEQARSLGAKFVDTGVDARGEGGYARELTAEEQAKVRQVLSQHIAEADMIITTAAVPGKRAPVLIEADQIAAMKPGRRDRRSRRRGWRQLCRHEAWRNGNGRAGNHSGAARRPIRARSARERALRQEHSQPADAHREGWRTRPRLRGRGYRWYRAHARRRNPQ